MSVYVPPCEVLNEERREKKTIKEIRDVRTVSYSCFVVVVRVDSYRRVLLVDTSRDLPSLLNLFFNPGR
jgi:hypothetical protein